MIKVRLAGFFREIETVRQTGDLPSIIEERNKITPAERRPIVKYLKAGECIVACGINSGDFFDPSRTRAADPSLATDGDWVWPFATAYYVERYGVGLPREFLDHMATNRWKPPKLSKADISAVLGAWKEDQEQ